MISDHLSPCGLQVRQWADGKERNIRALLSSLHTILWEGESKWAEVGMHQLLQPDQVWQVAGVCGVCDVIVFVSVCGCGTLHIHVHVCVHA